MALPTAVEESLTHIVGPDRVRTDLVERTVNSIDIGEMPPAIKSLLPVGTAGAVVRPRSEEQIQALVALAQKDPLHVRLVPRAAATSGYGGALPVKDAIVVVMTDWNEVLSVDPRAMTVRVQTGAIWQDVDVELAKHGLTLRLYPSSYPSSTVGGWLAQGGGGYGSTEYGLFKDNVVGARVVLPNGEIRELTGEALRDYVADAEGTTGIITEVLLLVRELEPEVHRMWAFQKGDSAVEAMHAAHEAGIPLWSMSFVNPANVALRKTLPDDYMHAYELAEAGREAVIPNAFLVLVAYPESRRGAVDKPLSDVMHAWHGTELRTEAAEREWEERFATMRLKKLGPSIIPAEIVVPLDKAGAVLDDIEREIEQTVILEGVVGKSGTLTMLGYILHDDRSLRFDVAYALSLAVLGIAKRHGGSAYSTGLYFRGEAESVLGKDWVEKHRALKDELDPEGFMNPGKVTGKGLLGVMMEAAEAFEPELQPFANMAVPPAHAIDETTAKHGIPGEVVLPAYQCARCGYCVNTCEQYSGRGWESQSPRGKWTFLREIAEGRAEFDDRAVHTFLVCTTCEVCDTRCQLQLPIQDSWMTMRDTLVGKQKHGTLPAFEIMAASLKGEKDIWAGKSEHRGDWVPADARARLKDDADVLYYAGCTSSFVDTAIAEASLQLLLDAGYDVAYMGSDEMCCGLPMKVAGKWDLFEESYDHNVAAARQRGAKTIVTSCPSCAYVWREFYPQVAEARGEPFEFDVRQYSELLAPKLADGTLRPTEELSGTYTFHDSCHLGRAQGIYEPPREMLAAIPGCDVVEMRHHHRDSLCCGSVLTLVGDIDVAPDLGERRLEEAEEAGADTIVTLCPCCKIQLRDANSKKGMDVDVKDLAYLVARSCGHAVEDTTPNATYQWSVFEKFIRLLDPATMAELMTKVFPQMFAAMPKAEQTMMLASRHVPGGMNLVEKLMPALFPKMAPALLDQVMPDLIEEVQAYVGDMPADMNELMPDLLPEAMHSLLPTYLDQLIPELVPRFIGFLQTYVEPAEAS
ncbi:MAG: FAD-binding and (Fe-S)-binding domain-containing protein [Gemmatimonadota bacterium]|jgi:Fe-S oxidoreductase/FAD/FMN-containing dehydrogenase